MIAYVNQHDEAEITFYENENEKLERLVYLIKKGMAFSHIKWNNKDDRSLIYTVDALEELCKRQRIHIERGKKR